MALRLLAAVGLVIVVLAFAQAAGPGDDVLQHVVPNPVACENSLPGRSTERLAGQRRG